MTVDRVLITEEAVAIVEKLKQKHGPLIFHQSGGCCDGSSPMCFEKDELFLNETDMHLGEIAGCPFYMSKDQFEYWKHTQIIVDVTHGRGSSFSLEIPLGLRFITKSKLFNDVQLKALGIL